MSSQAQPTHGIVMYHNYIHNTVDILIAPQSSNKQGEMLFNVPYPTTNGVQMVAPEVGTPCWVQFKGGDYSTPMVTNFFNHVYEETRKEQQYKASNDIPKFMINM